MSEQTEVLDSSGNNNHGIIKNQNYILRNQPPILGKGTSYHFQSQGYLEMGTLSDFGRRMSEGFYMGIDIQSESKTQQSICGVSVSGETAFVVQLNTGGVFSRLQIEIRDDDRKLLRGYTQLSNEAAKRLFISVDPPNNNIEVYEINLHEVDITRNINYLECESPTDFSDFRHPFLVSGYNSDCARQGSFRGRISQIFFNNKILCTEQVDRLRQASREEIKRIYGQRPNITYSAERQELFIDHLTKLRRWSSQATLSRSDMRDASSIVFVWLFDTNALLQDLCDELGLQLSLPGASDRKKNYFNEVLKDQPSFYQTVNLGVDNSLGFKWVSLSDFRDEVAFHVQGHTVSHRDFVKMVRNKLGGGHFDILERKQWQMNLKTYSDAIRLGGHEALNLQMKMLVEVLLQTVESCGIETQLAA